MKVHYIISYDIADPKRLRKVARLMEDYSIRVQKSVFEGFLSERELRKLISKAEKIINQDEDSIRIYRLCATCENFIKTIGTAKSVIYKTFDII